MLGKATDSWGTYMEETCGLKMSKTMFVELSSFTLEEV